MPIYAFLCDACNHSFDRLQKLSDPDPAICPECGAEAVRRQVTAPAFRLAGSGWYETDFKKGTDKRRNLAGDSGTEAGKSDTAPKSDTGGQTSSAEKPAAKPAAAKTSST
ncbi:MAG: zinc ribbon domain-containing protein [Rhodanobacteraceae bacterium]